MAYPGISVAVMGNAIALATVRSMCANGTAKATRQAATLSIREVADEVGVAASTIFRWESGRRVPHGPAAIAYHDLLRALMERAA